jgi:hypothetical protein
MQHANVTKDNPLGEKQIFYENYISGCVKHYGDKGNRCLDNEKQRLSMNLRQPQGMYNYVRIPFASVFCFLMDSSSLSPQLQLVPDIILALALMIILFLKLSFRQN